MQMWYQMVLLFQSFPWNLTFVGNVNVGGRLTFHSLHINLNTWNNNHFYYSINFTHNQHKTFYNPLYDTWAYPDSPTMVMDGEESGPGAWVNTEKVAPVSKRKSMDWTPTIIINTLGSLGVIRMGACVGTPGYLQSWLPWEPDPWALCLIGQYLLQCGPLQTWTWTWSQGWLRQLRVISLEISLLCTIITCLSLFSWVPLAIVP